MCQMNNSDDGHNDDDDDDNDDDGNGFSKSVLVFSYRQIEGF